MTETIGFIGLGNMGSPMAINLLKAGYNMRVYNRDLSKTQTLVDAGAKRGVRPSDVVEHGGIVITMLANDEALEAVTLGIDGILTHLSPGGIHISMSTVSPDLARKMQKLHEQQGCHYVAAPVFGRPEAAAARQLWIAEAGHPEAKKRVRPILDALGQGIFDFGEEAANANVVKISGNFLLASAMEAMGEAFTLGEKNGVERTKMYELFTQTLFACPAYKSYGKRIAEKNFEPVGFTMQLALKDINLVLDSAKEVVSPMPLASHLSNRLLSGIARGRSDRDWSELSRGVLDDAGIE
ncbi:NAD(P)-dependent oxidoreductase [Dictyobacter kobayashii]|uniref:Putative oxidoreductase YfjR n=1 Tax=Dictyobacter kobayashii TaxID=2014872 RepID=A0A402AWF8_9CHLR|nr:NAD(P)-dependent oxidoreductase [Dictyobacter kobayashii]GCE23436.1 putative oxidoreductase YfjR [Dictyobacter kobayashii]